MKEISYTSIHRKTKCWCINTWHDKGHTIYLWYDRDKHKVHKNASVKKLEGEEKWILKIMSFRNVYFD